MDRRTFIGSSAAASFSVGTGLGTSDATAFVPFAGIIGRIIAGFAGRTIARGAVRSAMRSGARASSRVSARTTRFGQHVRTQYPHRTERQSYPFIEYSSGELGQYGGELAYDYVSRLNAVHQGGQETLVVYNQTPQSAGAGFSTGYGTHEAFAMHAQKVSALNSCSIDLEFRGFSHAIRTGLLYPVSDRHGLPSRTPYSLFDANIIQTAFGHVEVSPAWRDHRDPNLFLVDVLVVDRIGRREFEFNHLII